MTGSALLGHPPNNEDDSLIVLGFYRAVKIPEAAWNKTSVIPVKTLPGAPHDTRQNEVIVSMAVAITLVVMITGTRLSLRLFMKDLHWGLDDWTIILAMLSVVAFFALALAAAVNGGAGDHVYDLTYAEFNTYLSLMWAGQILFYPTVALIKISIVLFNRRLTGLTSRKWMIFHNTLLCLLVLYAVITILINVFICIPLPTGLEILSIGRMSKPPRWINQKPLVPAFSAIHIAFDFILLLVPLMVLSRMKMAFAKKARLLFLFSIGVISTVGAVMRSVVQPTAKQIDITYKFPDYFRWSIVDCVFAITAASLPTLNYLIPKRWDESRGSNTNVVNPGVNGGGLAFEPKVTSGKHEIRELSFKSGNSLTDEESGSEKQSAVTKVGTQPDWNDFHPEIKIPN
ncbi:hypothetical protein N7G274_010764 [Stereocaulon virgatum]|uniref:Rhodopsin domain-containing protein n=1 Tax=Stereocaulon virgatum TaxID=373712 RepID=A0ABR3ZUW1_9LECA